MKRFAKFAVVTALVISCTGGGALAQEASGDEAVATVNGQPITMRQLQEPLLRAYGMNVLRHLAQLEMVKQNARQLKITVSPEDVQNELNLTIEKMFQDAEKEEHENLFEQFLQKQRISRGEFELVMETNAYLRKMAEPLVEGRITEAALQERFRATYGETIVVRHIEVSNLQEIAEAKRRLAAGEAFEQVARQLSRNARTAEAGGKLPPFSRHATDVPQAFKDAALALDIGEVSDPVLVDQSYHLIKLEQRLEPRAVKFDDVRDSIREDLHELLVDAFMKQLRVEIGQQTLNGLKIQHPELKRQFDEALEQRDAQMRDRDQIRRELEKERERRAAEQGLPTVGPDNPPAPAPVE